MKWLQKSSTRWELHIGKFVWSSVTKIDNKFTTGNGVQYSNLAQAKKGVLDSFFEYYLELKKMVENTSKEFFEEEKI